MIAGVAGQAGVAVRFAYATWPAPTSQTVPKLTVSFRPPHALDFQN